MTAVFVSVPPVYRFVDLTLEYADQDWEKTGFAGTDAQSQVDDDISEPAFSENADDEMEDEA